MPPGSDQRPIPVAAAALLPGLVPFGVVPFLASKRIRERAVGVLNRIVVQDNFMQWLGACLMVGTITFLILVELDSLLKGMHLPGRPSAGILEIGGPLTQWRDTSVVEHTNRIVDVWRDHSVAVEAVDRRYGTGQGLSALFAAVDSFLFVPFYAMVLGLVTFRAVSRAREDALEVAAGKREVLEITPEGIGAAIPWVLAVLVLADLGENFLQWLSIDQAWAGEPSAWVVRGVKAFGLVKSSLLLVAVIFAVGGLAFAYRPRRLAFERRRGALVNVRLQIVVLALFAAVLIIPEQAWDVPRSWSLVNAITATGLTALLGYVSWSATLWLLPPPERTGRRRALSNATLIWSGLVLTIVGLVFRVLIGVVALLPWGLLIPGLLLLATGLLSWIITRTSERPAEVPRDEEAEKEEREAAEREGATTARVARVLATVPLVILGLAMVRASAGHLFYAHHIETLHMGLLLGGGAVGLPVLAGLLYLGLRPQAGRAWRAAVLIGAGALVAVAVAFAASSTDTALELVGVLGVVGLVATFLVLVVLIGAVALEVAQRVEPPALFQLFRLKRTPVIALGAVWLVLATVMEPGGYHDARLMGARSLGPTESGITLEEAFDRWLQKNGLQPPEEGAAGPLPPVGRPVAPLVMVAASGGGIRAAFWTAAVLDCLTEVPPAAPAESTPQVNPCDPARPRTGDFERSDRLFAASGISGGSLGLASYAAYLAGKAGGVAEDAGWVRDRLSDDFLSPDLAWLLFVETFRSLLLFRPETDRAEVMERSWERPWGAGEGEALSAGLLATQREVPEVPLLLLNGATVNEGCRFNGSVLNVGPDSVLGNCLSIIPFEGTPSPRGTRQSLVATQDLVDYLCAGQDIRLSTLSHLSARFPFVSPAGRLTAQCAPEGSVPPVTYIVDGGYFDTSAASPVVELSSGLAPSIAAYNRRATDSCVVPFMVQVDNGYDTPDPPPRDRKPSELLAPKQARDVATQAWIANAKQAAAAAFTRPFESGRALAMAGGWPLSDRYVHIYPRAHPGVQAPLGWALSNAAREDLRSQLGSKDNAGAIAEVRSWFAAGPTCASEVGSAEYAGGPFGLGFPLDLTGGWWVTETAERLSLFREGGGVRVSITGIRGEGAEAVVRDLRGSLEQAGIVLGDPRPVQVGPASGLAVDVPAPNETREHMFRGIRFEQEPGQAAELLVLDVPGATLIVAVVRDPGAPTDLASTGLPRVLG